MIDNRGLFVAAKENVEELRKRNVEADKKFLLEQRARARAILFTLDNCRANGQDPTECAELLSKLKAYARRPIIESESEYEMQYIYIFEMLLRNENELMDKYKNGEIVELDDSLQ